MRARFASLFLFALGCSSDPTPAPADAALFFDGSALDAPTVDRPSVDAPAVDRPASTDGGGASCGTGFGTRCNLISGAGCTTGQGCYLVNGVTGQTAQCRPAGSAGWDEPCQSATDCREGFLCVDPGRCVKLCCGDDDSLCNDESRGGRAGAHCMSTLTDGRGLKLCVSDSGCDPFATSNNRCPTDSPRCNPLGDTTACIRFATGCTPGGDGAPCCESGCCQPGLLCVGAQPTAMCSRAMPGNACRRACNLRAAMPDAGCPSGQRCTAFGAMTQLPSYYGFCMPM